MKARVSKLLADVAKAAHEAADAAEEGSCAVSVPVAEWEKLTAALDALDKLPDVPGSASDGWHKAQHWLNQAEGAK